MRKRILFNSPEWTAVPWVEIAKTPKDLLLDILVEIPALLEDLDLAIDCPDADRQRALRQQLIQNCWTVAGRLSDWRIQVIGIADPAYQLNVDTPSPSLDLLAASHIMSLYWSICVILYSTLRIASGAIASMELPPQTEPRPYCQRIAEAVSLLLHPVSGLHGIQLANFPATVALLYLNAVDGGLDSQEKRIFVDVFKRPGHGATVETFISSTHLNLEERTSPQTERPDAVEAQAKAWLRMERG